MSARKREEAVLAALAACFAAYDANSEEFFDFFTRDASVFSAAFPTRLEGREAYRKLFGDEFTSHLRCSHLFDPEVRLMGDGALVSCHRRVRSRFNSLDSRMTILLVTEDGRLKIAHLHISPLASPPATGTSGMVEDVVELADEF